MSSPRQNDPARRRRVIAIAAGITLLVASGAAALGISLGVLADRTTSGPGTFQPTIEIESVATVAPDTTTSTTRPPASSRPEDGSASGPALGEDDPVLGSATTADDHRDRDGDRGEGRGQDDHGLGEIDDD
jgi:hypothetical protein